jgi:hypothetical protein
MNTQKLCSVEGCGNIHQSKGYCDKHYRRFRAHGDPLVARIPFVKAVCSVEGCLRESECKGFCKKHHARFVRWGDPLMGNTDVGGPQKWILDNAGHDDDECLIWPFARYPAGYGYLIVGKVKMSASRRMCMVAHGDPDSPELHAAHSCGNGFGGCVNPKHLRWATKLENEMDKIIHGTIRKGEKHGMHKLTEDEVRQIRSLRPSHTATSLGRKFGVSRACIDSITNGKNWSWLK